MCIIYIYIYIYIYHYTCLICMCVDIYTYICICIYNCICIHIYIYIYIYMITCMNICIHMHMHTHTCIYVYPFCRSWHWASQVSVLSSGRSCLRKSKILQILFAGDLWPTQRSIDYLFRCRASSSQSTLFLWRGTQRGICHAGETNTDSLCFVLSSVKSPLSWSCSVVLVLS